MYIPRQLIYEDRKSLYDFDIDTLCSIDNILYKELWKTRDIERERSQSKEDLLRDIFNDAYYIVTYSLMCPHPELKMDIFISTARRERFDENGLCSVEPVRSWAVMGMVLSILVKLSEESNQIELLIDDIRYWLNQYQDGQMIAERMVNATTRCFPLILADFPKRKLTPYLLNTINWEEVLGLSNTKNPSEDMVNIDSMLNEFCNDKKDRIHVLESMESFFKKSERKGIYENYHVIEEVRLMLNRAGADIPNVPPLPQQPQLFSIASDISKDTKEVTKNKNTSVDNNCFSDDSSIHENPIPFEIVDANEETIIHRTSDGINDKKLNPYEVNWMEVTLYEITYVRYMLELTDSELIMDVAKAIDYEESKRISKDGQYTAIISNFYGTEQGNPNQYSYIRNNWEGDSITAVSIAQEILELRKKSEAYQKKINYYMGETNESDKDNIPEFTPDIEQLLKEIADLKNEVFYLGIDKADLEQQVEEKGPEQAFNTQTGLPCFTNKQMGIFVRAIADITEAPNPPGKTTLGEVIEHIAGYKETTVNQNMKGAPSENDKKVVAEAIKKRMPKLAAKVRKL